MGTCLSKKKGSSTSSSSSVSATTKFVSVSTSAEPDLKKNSVNDIPVSKPKVETEPEAKIVKKTVQQQPDPAQEDEGGQSKKEIFIIKHRKSHDDRERNSNSKCPPPVRQNAPKESDPIGVPSNEENNNEAAELVGTNKIVTAGATMGVGVRTSSCTKEEVDAILIQCGRLSRSSSGKAASSSASAGERRRRYSGSKRSYDFDHCDNDTISAEDDPKRANGTDNSSDLCEQHQHRPRSRQSPRRTSSSSQGRRRTPSRERDQQNQNQRSSSRERRVSRSPNRRSSETSSNPTSNTTSASAIANASNNNNSNSNARPGKMVSVPPTVSSLAMDKSNNGESAGVKRISVKRNVGDSGTAGSRSAASPRSQSPARANGNGNAANSKAFNENHQQQQPSLSRSSSRKAEHSPYRRNPLSEIDPNSLAYPQSANNKKPNVDVNDSTKNRTRGVSANCKPKDQQEEEVKGHSSMIENVVVKTIVPSGADNNLKPHQTLTRSRSSRRSRDLDINPEALLNHEPSYTSLLLEDIHNFHQKNTITNTTTVPIPACVTKACSILEAVADLNSATSLNLSDDPRSNNVSSGANHYGKKRVIDTKDPFVESEVVVLDDVMEPSFHKYVTVKRGGVVDMEDQESSGSNSFTVSGQQNWGFSTTSSWEPNSADSTDCWTSRLNSTEEGQKTPLGLGCSLVSHDVVDEARKKSGSRRRECDHQHSNGIGRGRLGANKGLLTAPVTAAAST